MCTFAQGLYLEDKGLEKDFLGCSREGTEWWGWRWRSGQLSFSVVSASPAPHSICSPSPGVSEPVGSPDRVVQATGALVLIITWAGCTALSCAGPLPRPAAWSVTCFLGRGSHPREELLQVPKGLPAVLLLSR